MKTVYMIGLTALIGLTGCFSLSRGETPQRHYVLGGGPPQAAITPTPDLAGIAIGVRRLQLAGYLETPFIVVRRGAHQIEFSEFHRWGEPLGGGINRAVVRALHDRAPFRAIDVAPWPLREQYDYLIQLHVLRFEGVAPDEPTASGGEVHLLATWEILRQHDGFVLARETTDYRASGWRVGDYASLVNLLGTGLNALTADLIASLEKLEEAKPVSAITR